jgi:hypothetical protein
MSAIVTLLSRNGRRSGTGIGVNSLGKKDVGCAADGVVAETLDGGASRHFAFARKVSSPNTVEKPEQGTHDALLLDIGRDF